MCPLGLKPGAYDVSILLDFCPSEVPYFSGVKQAFRLGSRVVPQVGKRYQRRGGYEIVKFRSARVKRLDSWGFPDAPVIASIVYRQL